MMGKFDMVQVGSSIEHAAALLRSGEVVAIPTETVYGLAANASDETAIARVYQLKSRPKEHPLILHIADSAKLEHYAVQIPEAAYQLAEAFWPGPLTLVLKKHPDVLDIITGGQDTVAIRSPGHATTQALLQQLAGALCAPSANRYGKLSPTTSGHVLNAFAGEIPYILEGGPCSVGIESTIIDLSHEQPRCLRPGIISTQEIESVLSLPLATPGENTPRVPGSVKTHYQPIKPIYLMAQDRLPAAVETAQIAGDSVCVLVLNAQLSSNPNINIINMPHSPEQYANRIYQVLHEIDASKAQYTLIECPLSEQKWHGIIDRLQRATQDYEFVIS